MTGDRVQVATHLEKVTPAQHGADTDCAADCNQVRAACGVLEAFVGSRVVVHGREESEPVVFPLGETVQVFDAGDCQYSSYERSFL